MLTCTSHDHSPIPELCLQSLLMHKQPLHRTLLVHLLHVSSQDYERQWCLGIFDLTVRATNTISPSSRLSEGNSHQAALPAIPRGWTPDLREYIIYLGKGHAHKHFKDLCQRVLSQHIKKFARLLFVHPDTHPSFSLLPQL